MTSFRYCGEAEARVFRDLDSRDAIVVPDHQILYAFILPSGEHRTLLFCGFLRGSSSEVGLAVGGDYHSLTTDDNPPELSRPAIVRSGGIMRI